MGETLIPEDRMPRPTRPASGPTPEATPPALAGKWGAGWFRIAAD